MWYVYVLRSLQDGNYYTGFTSDLRRRLEDHNAGKLARRLGYLDAETQARLADQAEEASRTLTGLIQAVVKEIEL